ncbi:MAG TPA: nitrile hydratase accessory protein [Caulobacteraceae bacterium]
MNRPEAPRENPFEEPWQAQAFALTVELHARGAFTWSEWATALSQAIAARPDGPYYEAWLAALEALTAAKGLSEPAELASRKAAWTEAYLHTPHGQPVALR